MNIFNNNNYILSNKYDSIKNSRLQSTYKQIENINNQSVLLTNGIDSSFSNYINSVYDIYSGCDNTYGHIDINEKKYINNIDLNNNDLNLQLLSINNQTLDSSLLSNTTLNEYNNVSSIINLPQINDTTNSIQNALDNLINNYIDSSSSNVSSNNSIENIDNSDITIDDVENWVKQSCKKYNLDPDLIMAIIKAESSFNPNAVSSSGAVGLMQLMPATAKEMGLVINNEVDERLNPQKNIEAGVKYIAKCHERISNHFGKENWNLTIAGYNCGPNRVIKEGKIPNITETQNYVKKVQKYWNEFKTL